MISSVALNSMLHHQSAPSSSTAASEINGSVHLSSSDSSGGSHAATTTGGAGAMTSCGGGAVYAPATSAASPMAFLFNALRQSAAARHSPPSPGGATLKRKLDYGSDIAKHFEHMSANIQDEVAQDEEDRCKRKSADRMLSEIDNDIVRPCDEEMEGCDSSVSPHNEKTSDSQVSNGVENFLKAQKALHKLTSQLSGLGQRSPFQNLGTISPFLVAAIQQQNIQQQLLAAQQQQRQNTTENGGSGGDDASGGDATPAGGVNKESTATAPFLSSVYLNTGLSFGGALRFNAHSDVDTNNEHTTALSATSSARSRNSFFGDEDEREELIYRRIEPEDLSLRDRRSDIDETGSIAPNSWSWEEQFKQLYELSNEPERREWLNDWLSFMHRIGAWSRLGKPVTRIPIMAKQVLDLYELYRLVVQHGGLVEIINKKLWREITKGLNLPNSITSAAFTLRTQYQKYLYDYECDRENLSCLADLQSAIEGNKREGRRNNPQGDTPGPMLSCGSSNGKASGLHSASHSMLSNAASSSAAKASNEVDAHRRNSIVGFPYGALTPHSMASFFGKGIAAFGVDRGNRDLAVRLSKNQNFLEELANELSGAFGAAGHAETLPPLAQFELLQKAALSAAMAAGNFGLGNNQHSNVGGREVDTITSSSATGGANSLKCRSATPPGGVGLAIHAKRARHNSGGYRLKQTPDADSTIASQNPYFMTRMKLNDKCFRIGGRESMRISVEMNGQTFEGVLFAKSSNSAPAKTAVDANTKPERDNADELSGNDKAQEQLTTISAQPHAGVTSGIDDALDDIAPAVD